MPEIMVLYDEKRLRARLPEKIRKSKNKSRKAVRKIIRSCGLTSKHNLSYEGKVPEDLIVYDSHKFGRANDRVEPVEIQVKFGRNAASHTAGWTNARIQEIAQYIHDNIVILLTASYHVNIASTEVGIWMTPLGSGETYVYTPKKSAPPVSE